MRQIKFRGKTNEGKWVYGDLLTNKLGTHIREDFEIKPTGGLGTIFHEVDCETVGQFTSLYDSTRWEELTCEEQQEFMKRYHLQPEDWKGKKIYEGDILGFTTKREMGYQEDGIEIYLPVVFGRSNPDNDTLSDYIGFWVERQGGYHVYRSSIMYEVDSHGAKVIGNIHDNPELINGINKK